MVKRIDEIKEELLDNDYCLSPQTIKDLAWHLEHDEDPHMAIILATDAKLRELAPLIAKNLDNKDDFIREVTVGCILEGLGLSEYAKKGLDMAQQDEDESVRNMAVFSLGAVINKVPFVLAQEIATYISKVFQYHESKVDRNSAYFSILKAMNVPWEKRPRVSRGVQESDIDYGILEAFCKKYKLPPLSQQNPNSP